MFFIFSFPSFASYVTYSDVIQMPVSFFTEYHDFFEGDRDQSDQGSSPEYPIFDRAQLIERYKVSRIHLLH